VSPVEALPVAICVLDDRRITCPGQPVLRPSRIATEGARLSSRGSRWLTDIPPIWYFSGPGTAVRMARMPDRKGRLLYAYLVAAYFVQTPQLDQISYTFQSYGWWVQQDSNLRPAD
jgi:hypothetical protein